MTDEKRMPERIGLLRYLGDDKYTVYHPQKDNYPKCDHAEYLKSTPPLKHAKEMRDALTNLSLPEYHSQGMGCGLEDRNITDRYDAMAYGWECAIEAVYELINPDDIKALLATIKDEEAEEKHEQSG